MTCVDVNARVSAVVVAGIVQCPGSQMSEVDRGRKTFAARWIARLRTSARQDSYNHQLA